jgi:NADPH:quinone reductase-like Zn-dependent oxidoreductase
VRAEVLVNSPDPERLARIAELVAGGDVHVEIAEEMRLADAKRAHELSEGGHVRGKLVLSLAA